MLLFVIGLQRVHELFVSKYNYAKIRDRILMRSSPREQHLLIVFHFLWFLSCIIEVIFFKTKIVISNFCVGIFILAFCQWVRYQTIKLLGVSWVTFPMVYRGQTEVCSGIYRFVKHPNYWVVIIEIFLVPFMGGAIWTAIVFGSLNMSIMFYRMHKENLFLAELNQNPEGVI